MKTKKTITLMAIALLVLLSAPVLSGRGAADPESGYPMELHDKFDELLTAVEEGTITKEEALEMILEFQQENNRVNREQYRYMEACLNDFEKGVMTRTQAREKVARMVQLKTEEPLMTQDRLQTQDRERIQLQEKDRVHQNDSGSGNSKRQ